MLEEFRQMPPQGQVQLSPGFKSDIYWWCYFMPQYNGVSVIPRPHWSDVNCIIATDACLSGCGGFNFVAHQYFHAEFPPDFLGQWSINELELLSIMLAVKVWAKHLKAERFRIHCDNTTAVAAMNLTRMRNRHVQACMREIAYWAAVGEFEVSVVHIEGTSNVLPDLLSRWHMSQTYQDQFFLHPLACGALEVKIKPEDFLFTGLWF